MWQRMIAGVRFFSNTTKHAEKLKKHKPASTPCCQAHPWQGLLCLRAVFVHVFAGCIGRAMQACSCLDHWHSLNTA
jgi:hypothetical protein